MHQSSIHACLQFSCIFTWAARDQGEGVGKSEQTKENNDDARLRMFNQKPPQDHPPPTSASFSSSPSFLALDDGELWSTMGGAARALRQQSRIISARYLSTNLLSSKHDQLCGMQTSSWRPTLQIQAPLARSDQPRLLQLTGRKGLNQN